MNKILLALAFLFSCITCIFAQGELPEETIDYAANFATFVGVVGVTAVVTEFIFRLPRSNLELTSISCINSGGMGRAQNRYFGERNT